MKFLFVQLGRIGDMVLLTPIFKAVKEKYPDAEIDVVASRRNYNVIQNNPRLNNIIVFEKSPVKFLKSIRKIRQKDYDYLIDPKDHYSRESRFLAHVVRAKTKIGFNPEGKSLYDISIPSDKENVELHCTERFFNALKPLSISINSDIPKPELFTSADSDEYVEKFIKENNLNNSQGTGEKGLGTGNTNPQSPNPNPNFSAINISATTKDRLFSISKWINILSDYKTQNNFVLTFAPDEKFLAQQLKGAIPNLILFPSRSINDVISLVKRTILLITVDTALVHIASAFNTPILSFHVGNEEQVKKYYPLSDVAYVMMSPSLESGIELISTCEINESLKLIYSINR